ncbi:M-phase phosphoprotein 8 isoform X2 [Pseudorasbora parva]|uniref:M-phase phosphoprotein 8 isoform X2 n=1 Tax=Pseudorasbora parva TaxID=51549 RepID=UPI00351EB775
MASGAERTEPGDSEQEEEDVYEVERIIDMRMEEGVVLYRVRWKNYSSEEDTWEPEAHLDDCREVLLAYKKALAEMKPKKETGMLPMKSDLFDADSESESDKEKPKESPIKKKKKKKKKVEESDDEMPVKEKKKKKKKDKWREDKPLPAPESDEEEEEEEEESRDPSPTPSKKETKKRLIESDDDDAPVTPKKQKKLDKPKDGGKQKKESGEDRKKKKIKSKREIDSSDEEDDKSDVPSETQTDDTTNTETNDSSKTTTAKSTDKSVRSESGGDLKQAKQKKAKSDLKLQGFKDLIQEKKPKKVEVSSALLKESGSNKLKNLTSSKSTSKSSRSEEEPDSSDTGAATPAPKSKVKSKGQEAALTSQRLSSASSSSSSSTASTAPVKPKEDEPKEEGSEKSGASNLFEKFLLNCEAKDRVPRRQADQNKNATPKGTGKSDKKTKLSKQSPARKPDSDKTEKAKDVPRSGQSPVSMEIDEKQEKGASETEKGDKSDEPAPKTKEELQREQREEEQRKRKEKMEEEERRRKERIEEEERKKKERIEEAQRERKARMEEAQRLAEEARQERLERKSMTESIASPDSTEDSRWKDKRRRSESRVFTTCDDNQDSQETMERSDKTPDRGLPSLNLGLELKLDWMTLEDFQKHLNGEDENLSPLALTPTELREAVKNGNYLAVKRALSSKEDYNLDQEDSSGMSLTLLAAAGGQDDVLRLLIKKGVKVNARQKNGTTALMHAAEKNFLTTVAILLEAGASVNAQTLGGETALMKACKRGNADVVRLLLEYGADCSILSKHKNTALYCAKVSNNVMVYDLIKDHMQTLSTVAEETIRAYFETRLALLEPVFPLACHRLCEGPDFSLEFNYKPPQHTPGEGSGILLFIFHANFLNEITARLCGPCSVHAVVLNDKFQLPIFLDSHFIYSFSPVQGANKLFIRLAESPTAKVKLLICAYRVQLQ